MSTTAKGKGVIYFIHATVVVRRHQTDVVYVKTNLASPLNVDGEKHSLDLEFQAPKGGGAAYVREHFGLEPEVIDIEPKDAKFSL